MEKKIKILITALLSVMMTAPICFGQKKKIEIETYRDLYEAVNPKISPDGKFASYQVKYNSGSPNKIVVKQTDGAWSFSSTVNRDNGSFSEQSNLFVFRSVGDTLCTVDLRSKKVSKVPGVSDFTLFMNGKVQWMVTKFKDKSIAVGPINQNPKFKLEQANFSLVAPTGDAMAYTTGKGEEKLHFVDLNTASDQPIFSGTPKEIIFDKTGRQLAFMRPGKAGNEIWYYNFQDKQARRLSDDHYGKPSDPLSITAGQFWQFNKDGTHIYFGLKRTAKQMDTLGFRLDIMSYEDRYMEDSYGTWLPLTKKVNDFIAVVSIKTGQMKQLTENGQVIVSGPDRFRFSNDYLIKTSTNEFVDNVGDYSAVEYFACNAINGSRVKVASSNRFEIRDIQLSPTGRFVTYFDKVNNSFTCFDTVDRISRKIAIEQSTVIGFREYGRAKVFYWEAGDRSFIYGDNLALFRIDPLCKQKKINLTSSFEKDSKKTFFPLFQNDKPIFLRKKLLVGSLDAIDKSVGILLLDTGKLILEKLFSANAYIGSYNIDGLVEGDLVKASNSNNFLLKMQGMASSPNFHFTTNFATFREISNIHSESELLWPTKKLYTFKSITGESYQGMLYVPQNFDAGKKYPLIIDIYKSKTDLLNKFPRTQLNYGELEVPIMVSQGYLVYQPDIFPGLGQPGKDALQAVEIAYKNLIKMDCIDSTRIGISGASYGGFETRYILTKSKLHFAAAMSNCGIANFTDYALGSQSNGSPGTYRNGPYRFEDALSKNSELYRDASAVFSVANVKTPLLMMHNERDNAIRMVQTYQFYTLLRELHKPAWWLNYPDEGHGVMNSYAALVDVNRRFIEFFDHYLKGAPKPGWMKSYRTW